MYLMHGKRCNRSLSFVYHLVRGAEMQKKRNPWGCAAPHNYAPVMARAYLVISGKDCTPHGAIRQTLNCKRAEREPKAHP